MLVVSAIWQVYAKNMIYIWRDIVWFSAQIYSDNTAYNKNGICGSR
jgi:hypothetical protein